LQEAQSGVCWTVQHQSSPRYQHHTDFVHPISVLHQNFFLLSRSKFWKDFDASHDSWVRRKFLTPLALQAYERFLTEHVRFCEERSEHSTLKSTNSNHKLKSSSQHLKSARERLLSFTGDGRYSVLKVSNNLSSSATTSPIAATSKTSDVAPNTPTVGVSVTPLDGKTGLVPGLVPGFQGWK
jgi:hypothetical protein